MPGITHAPDAPERFQRAVDLLEAASKTSARSRATKVGPIVDEICEHAFQRGIAHDELRRLVSVVTVRTELDQTSVTSLVKNLYPTSHVPSDIVLAVANCLGPARRNPAPSTQAALVQWLTAVLDILEDQNILARLYSTLFNLLDFLSIRTPLCQLLSLVTKRSHVRPFRIQRLLELAQQTASEPALLGLLGVYKNFCPEIIVGAVGVSKTPRSSVQATEWRQRLAIIQQMNATESGGNAQRSGFRLARNSKLNGHKLALPYVHTFHAAENKKSLEEFGSASDLIDNLERIETPSQVVAALRDPLLQKYLLIGGSDMEHRRLDLWLGRCFEAELESVQEGFGQSTTLHDVLAGLVDYAEYTKALPPVVERFLERYIPLWNGTSDIGAILDLVSYMSPQPYEQLYRSILAPLERSVLHASETPIPLLFDFYANLTQRWMLSRNSVDAQIPKPFSKSTAVFDLTQHVAILAESALATDQCNATAVITFYERIADTTIAQIDQGRQLLPPILPPQTLLYTIVTMPSSNNLSRICALLATYKRGFETQEPGATSPYQPNATALLNGYLMDMTNLLWRSRALNATDPNAAALLCPQQVATALGSYLPRVDREYNIHSIFDFSHNALLAALSRAAFADMEKDARDTAIPSQIHAGPVTQRSLAVLEKDGGIAVSWRQYRIYLLEWLAKHGLVGIRMLMLATLKDLRS